MRRIKTALIVLQKEKDISGLSTVMKTLSLILADMRNLNGIVIIPE